MANTFIERVRSGSIISPVRRGFCISDWCDAWSEELPDCKKAEQIYSAGLVFDVLFGQIRSQLRDLYDLRPAIENKKLIKLYIAISNRDRAIMSREASKNIENASSIFNATYSNNALENEITLEEIATTCVDGVEKAIRFCLQRIQKGETTLGPDKSVDALSFVTSEAQLSSMYDNFESYWQALLWGDYSFVEVDKAVGLYEIAQQKTEYEVAYESSQIRRSRHSAHSVRHAASPDNLRRFNEDKFLRVVKSRRTKLLKASPITESQSLSFLNAAWRESELSLPDEFPSEFLSIDHGLGFSLYEALDGFRLLMLLANSYVDQFPCDDSFYAVAKLGAFCPTLKVTELKRGIVLGTGMTHEKVCKILDFFEFRDTRDRDLWCHPLVKIGSEVFLVASALVTPNIVRLVEHWLVRMNVRLDKKGLAFEEVIRNELNNVLSTSDYVDDFSEVVGKKFRYQGAEEEIDFLGRVGNLLLIGESKSIVTTDSPISKYRSLQTLKGAAAQVKRKVAFVKRHLSEIARELDWPERNEAQYEIVGLIVNSSKLYSGFSISDVPVCDSMLLCNYFRSGTVAELTTFDQVTGARVDHAWRVMYSDFIGLQKNFRTFLDCAPQVAARSQDFEHRSIKAPYFQETGPKFLYSRLLLKDTDTQMLLEKDSPFPLETADNIEAVLREIQVTY